MDWLLELRPIRAFSLYLVLVFAVGVWRRWRQYRTVLSLLVRFRSRWPNLAQLVFAHRHIFLTWGTLRPLIVVVVVFLANTLASWYIWPSTDRFRVADLFAAWPLLALVAVVGAGMTAFDVYGVLVVTPIDQVETEQYFDQAEYWLRGWKAPVVRFLSLGYVNPRQIVAREVRTALESAAGQLNYNLWWMSVQTALRIAFGLSLWLGFALEGPVRRLLGAE
jgi:hypothetical protein